jgi:hypothetical protein
VGVQRANYPSSQSAPDRQPLGESRYGLGNINAVAARQMMKDNLYRTRQKTGPQQNTGMPPSPGLGRGVDPHNGTAALGMINVMSDVSKYTSAGGTPYLFALFH